MGEPTKYYVEHEIETFKQKKIIQQHFAEKVIFW